MFQFENLNLFKQEYFVSQPAMPLQPVIQETQSDKKGFTKFGTKDVQVAVTRLLQPCDIRRGILFWREMLLNMMKVFDTISSVRALGTKGRTNVTDKNSQQTCQMPSTFLARKGFPLVPHSHVYSTHLCAPKIGHEKNGNGNLGPLQKMEAKDGYVFLRETYTGEYGTRMKLIFEPHHGPTKSTARESGTSVAWSRVWDGIDAHCSVVGFAPALQ